MGTYSQPIQSKTKGTQYKDHVHNQLKYIAVQLLNRQLRELFILHTQDANTEELLVSSEKKTMAVEGLAAGILPEMKPAEG